MKPRGFFRRGWDRLALFEFAGARMRGFLDARDTGALSCYHITLAPGARIEPAYHKKAVELIWVMRGGGAAKLGRSRVRLTAGDSLFIRPPTSHGFVAGRSGMTIFAALSPRVDSMTDYYSCHRPYSSPRVLSGRWTEGPQDRRH